MNEMKLNFEKAHGLLPVIIQSIEDNSVLMLAYMNQEALQETIRTGCATFYSRSRAMLWTKGETSGNYFMVDEMQPDCDGDALLVRVRPLGPCCHENTKSCFFHFLHKLEQIIASRKKASPDSSYVAKLFQAGPEHIVRKVGEEALEVAIASLQKDTEAIREETADLIFHLLINLAEHSITFDEVVDVLKKRNKEKKEDAN